MEWYHLGRATVAVGIGAGAYFLGTYVGNLDGIFGLNPNDPTFADAAGAVIMGGGGMGAMVFYLWPRARERTEQ